MKIASLFVATLLALSCHVASAQAELARTFVSSLGNDANDCGRLTPCRTFQTAHTNTLNGGEITVLDPGGYGALTITKAISIINDGVGEAGGLVSGGLNGITVNAGVNDAVALRGLTIKGIGFGGGNGIRFNTGRSLTIENSAIRTLDGAGLGQGLLFGPNGTSNLAVANTVLTDNVAGILVQPTGSGVVKVAFNRVEIYNHSANAFFLLGNSSTGKIDATAADSVAANNGDSGFRADSSSAATKFTVVRSLSANNFRGLVAQGPSPILWVAQSTVTGNTAAWTAEGGGGVFSYGDNNMEGNAFSAFPPTPTPKK